MPSFGDPSADQLERQSEAEQPLLGAVMEVTLEPTSLVVPRADDSRSRGAKLLELGAQLGMQPFVLEREPHCRSRSIEQRLLICQVRVVHDRCEVVPDQGDRPRRSLTDRDLATFLVHPGAPVRKPECELEGRVADRLREGGTDAARPHAPQFDDEPPDRPSGAPRREDPYREGDRHRDSGGAVDPDQWLLPAGQLKELRHRTGNEQGGAEPSREGERPQRASDSGRRPPDPARDEPDEDRAEHDEEPRKRLADRVQEADLPDEEQGGDSRRAVSAIRWPQRRQQRYGPEDDRHVDDPDRGPVDAIDEPPCRVREHHVRVDRRQQKNERPANRDEQARIGQEANGVRKEPADSPGGDQACPCATQAEPPRRRDPSRS